MKYFIYGIVILSISLFSEKTQSCQTSLSLPELDKMFGELLEQLNPRLAQMWKKFEQRQLTEREKIKLINVMINKIPYSDDQKTWGQKDYWASPVEFLEKEMGDCEDYAIAKYYLLKKMGIAEEHLKLVYGRDDEVNDFHMVLAYYPVVGGDAYILDNRRDEIREIKKLSTFHPLYQFNQNSMETYYNQKFQVHEVKKVKNNAPEWIQLQQRIRL